MTISIGGEIGEVGTQNSTVPELRAFMDGFVKALEQRAPGAVGLSKISVQTGTSHGGVVLPDGGIADVKLDLEALEALSKVARDEFGMSGAVQHGASTLPESAFDNFPRIETAEIHLATNFQNMLFEQMPAELRGADLRVARREREGRAQEGRLRRAVLLQEPQEGARSVQARAVGSAGRREGDRSRRRTTRPSASSSSSFASAARRTR